MTTLVEKKINCEESIRKLAALNNVEYGLMYENWTARYDEFDAITDNAGIMDDVDHFSCEDARPVVALTAHGSILIISPPDEDRIRKVRYQKIDIRTDSSQKVPELFADNLNRDISLGKPAVFGQTMASSPIILIKTSDLFNWEAFEDKADQLTRDLTSMFALLDHNTLTKQIEFSRI